MKLTVVTDEVGNIVGATEGHTPRPDVSRPAEKTTEFRAGLMAGPGQRLFEIEAPDELRRIKDPDEFGKRLAEHAFREGLIGK